MDVHEELANTVRELSTLAVATTAIILALSE
jgi:hypothetical protein